MNQLETCLLKEDILKEKQKEFLLQKIQSLSALNVNKKNRQALIYGSQPKKTKYHDRASERRERRGDPESIESGFEEIIQLSDLPHHELKRPCLDGRPGRTSTGKPIGESNVGHQMLVKMGWNRGQGIGKEEQGRTVPLTVNQRKEKLAGLGFG